METTEDCVQESIGEPTFWNVILDSLVDKLSNEEVHYQAFADDMILAFSGRSIESLQKRANSVLQVVVPWGDRNKVKFAPLKTKVILFTRNHTSTSYKWPTSRSSL
ncbi:Retrovirus-related Pol polyprotein from type-1 retrotransposable element R1 [Eumeta japonica]|uniref:Retrovirus-related Pol polyprotein from type-1 retrotransposable element R1 n=1 Tax=Eumeta variegata TaxID=151549 RepID=A0A4C1VPK5_EUMVA|nr:Retrovirus-related Pol polyprotein from type-1 retrotransposable element R1 [Eumeta japonica]